MCQIWLSNINLTVLVNYDRYSSDVYLLYLFVFVIPVMCICWQDEDALYMVGGLLL